MRTNPSNGKTPSVVNQRRDREEREGRKRKKGEIEERKMEGKRERRRETEAATPKPPNVQWMKSTIN